MANLRFVSKGIANQKKIEFQISAHFEDENNKKIEQEEIKTQTVFLVIVTKDTVGQTLSLNIEHQKHYFKYKGKTLENGILENLQVTADTMRLELEAIHKPN